MVVSNELQADAFAQLAHQEFIWELVNGQCPDVWEQEKFVIWGRLAILGLPVTGLAVTGQRDA